MRLVLVEWVDSYGCSPGWTSVADPLDPPAVMACQSVGWLAHDGPDCKVLIPHVADMNGGRPGQGCGDMTIPTCAVRRVVELGPLQKRRRA